MAIASVSTLGVWPLCHCFGYPQHLLPDSFVHLGKTFLSMATYALVECRALGFPLSFPWDQNRVIGMF